MIFDVNNVVCNRILDPLFSDTSVAGNVYIDLLIEYVSLQLHNVEPIFIFQQDHNIEGCMVMGY